MKTNVLILMCLLAGICNSQSPVDPTDICQLSDLSIQKQWNLFKYSNFEIYFTLTLGSIAAILLILSLLSWLCFPSFLLPSDIIFIILGGTFLDISTLIITAVYSLINQSKDLPQNYQSFCNGIGFFNMLGNVIYIYYNAFFCGALAYTIHKTLKKPLLSIFKQHIICLFISIIAFLIMIFTSTPQPFSSMCLYRLADSSSLGLFFLHLILAVFSLYSLYSFKRNIPKNTFFEQQSHFKYYFIYMVIFFIFETIESILFITGNLSCSTRNSNRIEILQTLLTISNCMVIILAFASVVLRLGHPFIMRRLRNVRQYYEISSQEHSQQLQEFSWVSSLVNSLKGSQVLSFIEAIMINYIEHIRKYPSTLSTYHFQRHYSFMINQNITNDYIRRRITNRQSHFSRQQSEGLTTLQNQVKIFTPQYYSWVFRKQNINLFGSFDLRKNLSLVKEQSYSQRGKKGEFFFCTYDHKILLKTISSEQANTLLDKTQDFHDYFIQNSESLIVKVLGLFRFQRKDIQNQINHLIIMKNMTSCHRDQISRTYDIKGTMANRYAMKEQKIKQNDQQKLRNYTLKDKDFKILQHKIFINQPSKEQIKRILARDMQFLSNIGLIDYSLLIIKRKGQATNQFGQYASTIQPRTFYHLGIIDYLEEYKFKKKSQKVFKTLITNQQNVENQPQKYKQRLMAFIFDIL